MVDKVKTVSEFLDQVNQKIKLLNKRTDTTLYAFRGEERIFPTPGMPNIFREKMISPSFEKNILDEVVSNGLSKGDNYLHRAIDAQHGGFPSRLLDITFNSVVALFFAVTPHFSKAIDSADGEDSVVIVYAIEEMFSADSSDTQEYYKGQISGNNNPISGYEHIFLDHTKRNTRISAQYGGFVMFSGSEYIPVPEFCQEKIIIDGKDKEQLREELQKVFGLTMATVYPESDHFVNYLKEKANILSNDIKAFTVDRRISLFKKEVNHYVVKIIDIEDKKHSRELVESVKALEECIVNFSFWLKSIEDKEDCNDNKEKYRDMVREIVKDAIEKVRYDVKREKVGEDVISQDEILNYFY